MKRLPCRRERRNRPARRGDVPGYGRSRVGGLDGSGEPEAEEEGSRQSGKDHLAMLQAHRNFLFGPVG